MNFRSLLLCSLLLGSFFNPSMAMNHRDDRSCEACAGVCLYSCYVCCAITFLSHCGMNLRCLHETSSKPQVSSPSIPSVSAELVPAPWDCNAGFLYGLVDATNEGTVGKIKQCEGLQSKNRRNQIKKVFLATTEPKHILNTHCRAGFYVGLADGGAFFGQAKDPAVRANITKMCPHLTPEHKEKLKSLMKRD